MSRWARMGWDATVPEGAALEIDARSGNGGVPADQAWSAWTGELTEANARISPPDARYLQYRLRMAGRPADELQVRRVEVLYLTRNQKPTLELDDPDPGEAIRAEYELSWTADDDDDDTLLTTIFHRAEGSDDWVEITMLEDEDKYDWDTTEVDGGRYDLRFVTSDEPSNPTGALSEELIVEGIVVDNGYPKLILVSKPRLGHADRTLSGMAIDELSRITSIDWTFVEKVLWRSALPDDGLLDSRRELFRVELPELPEGETSVQIRIRDAAGNVTVETLPLLEEPHDDADTGPMQAEGDDEAVG